MGIAEAPKTHCTQSNSGMDVGSSGRPQATFSPTTTLEPTYATRARAVAASIASPAITTKFFPQLTANSTAELAGVVQVSCHYPSFSKMLLTHKLEITHYID